MEWRKKIPYAAANPRAAFRFLRERGLQLAAGTYNSFVDLKTRPNAGHPGLAELDEIKEHARKRTDISDHLVTLFVEALAVRPRLLVELGVRGGESTFVLERVARLSRAKLVSVDIEDCTKASRYPDWIFLKGDDVEIALGFEAWCRRRNIEPNVDVLFIDTSHLFEHTCREIESWFPYLSERSKVFFHDTNLKKVCFRKDGSIALAWDNQRGVVAAIEKVLGKSFNEERDFVDVVDGWIIKHYAYCSGFTILEKVGSLK